MSPPECGSPNERRASAGTMETAAAVARGACMFINESAGIAFKNRKAGRSQIELLGMCDYMLSPPFLPKPPFNILHHRRQTELYQGPIAIEPRQGPFILVYTAAKVAMITRFKKKID